MVVDVEKKGRLALHAGHDACAERASVALVVARVVIDSCRSDREWQCEPNEKENATAAQEERCRILECPIGGEDEECDDAKRRHHTGVEFPGSEGRVGVADQLGHERNVRVEIEVPPEVLPGHAISEAKDARHNQSGKNRHAQAPGQSPPDQAEERE